MELEEIRRNILTLRDGEKIQEINNIPVIEDRIQNQSDPVDSSETEIRVHVKIADEERLIIDQLKVFMIRR